ncbi:protein arginine N-methyltransferase 1.6 isoform X1 [Carya illinoinensis]|uniref:protein arginine N-methyltransferase 1.6 isoform X1 n=1 Tax=Carya illinoinensis TaxID=32201 RepID=UPI001C7244A5|nr:protein arginine N-methyltransferase 1.6 isoform X1 [Carya illinoinensis]
MASLIPKTLIPIRSLPPFTRFKATATRAMSSGSTQRVFQHNLDPLTGNSEWVVIEDQDQEEQVSEIPHKPLLGTTSYLDMLNDSPRNRAFCQAIDKTVTKPCHVLDIGAGTGLLSMMAARQMGSSDSTTCRGNEGMVTACESYLPMVKLMRKVARLNGMERKIKVINKRSDELKVGVDIPSRADILVSEILDSELLGEGLIPTLQHAHDELLVENPQTVPYRATTYGQLVESTFLWKLHDLQNNEAEGCDGIHLVPSGLGSILGVKPQQYAMHCDAIKDEIKLLSEPFKIFEFDFWKRPDSHREYELNIKATNDGRVNAVVSWWTLQLDCEGNFFYSTAPRWISSSIDAGSRYWCDHWKQCVWFVPGKGISVFKDEEVYLHAVHSDTSISYNLKAHASRNEVMQYGFDTWDLQLMLSPERIAIYGDNEWRHSMLKTLRNARYSLQLQERVNSLCIVADDSVFLTLLVAHLSRTSHIISMFPGLRDKGAQYLQAVANANGFSIDHVTVLEKRKTYLTLDDTHQKKVDLLIGEPFYYGLDGMLPWQNLRFWKERTVLDHVLSEDVLIMPCKGILKACAMSLPDLWNSRRCLSKIEGFDHSLVNTTLGACGELPAPEEGPCLPFYIWQCGEIKELGQKFEVMEFDFSKPIAPCYGKAQVDFTVSGICHGFALWIDWVMDSENSIVVSTGPDKRYWKQGVKLLAHPVAVGINESRNVGEHTSMVFEASFDPSNGELTIRHDFL